MKSLFKKILLIIMLIIILIFNVLSVKSNAVSVVGANYKSVSYKTKENNKDTKFPTNYGTLSFARPAMSYDFIDEEKYFNTVYVSDNNVYWSKFDNALNIKSTVSWPLYYNMNKEENLSSVADALTYNFGNAIYYNKYLYVVYSRMANYSGKEERRQQNVMAVGKYDKTGKQIAVKEYLGVDLNASSYEDNGTSVPFYTSNCSLTVNNGDIVCFFGRNMFNGHQSSYILFINPETLEFENNMVKTTQENRNKFYKIYNHTISHSLGQRIISTSDGRFLLAEVGDAGSTRGLMVTKLYDYYDETYDLNTINRATRRMVHFSEGSADTWGYNKTYSVLGNLVELSDGYMYIGGMEKTLSRAYGKEINEPWNIFVQKYKKDFYTKSSAKDMQLLNTEVRKTSGEPAEYNGYGRLYLTGSEEDYGMKWLTNFKNECVDVVRAVKIENDNVVILWEQMEIYKNSLNYFTWDESKGRKVYYMVIDKNANIVTQPTLVENVVMNNEEQYVYKDGKIYWTSIENNNLKINVLDINNPDIPFKDVKKTDWYYNAVKYTYMNTIISGYSSTKFAPNDKITRAMIVTMLYNMSGRPNNNGISKFSDVKNNEWYSQAIKWASDNKIISGYSGTSKFGPDDNILRQDLVVILKNYANYKKKNTSIKCDLSNFSDYKKIDDYAQGSMQWAVKTGVINGNDNGTLNPRGNATRAEAAAMLQKYVLKIGK